MRVVCCITDVYLVTFVSTKKLCRIAVTILLFPSVCFTNTQLHRNSFIHNVSGVDVKSVLDHLVECDLLVRVQRGLKTSRRSTCVYVKRLPHNGLGSVIDGEHRLLFIERLEEFNESHPELTINSYFNESKTVIPDASGTVTEELLGVLALPEYASVEKSAIHSAVSGSIMFVQLILRTMTPFVDIENRSVGQDECDESVDSFGETSVGCAIGNAGGMSQSRITKDIERILICIRRC